jgi:hypothetical protein
VVVLHKLGFKAGGLRKGPLVEALEEKTAGITEDPRLDQQHIGDGARCDLHIQNTWLPSI